MLKAEYFKSPDPDSGHGVRIFSRYYSIRRIVPSRPKEVVYLALLGRTGGGWRSGCVQEYSGFVQKDAGFSQKDSGFSVLQFEQLNSGYNVHQDSVFSIQDLKSRIQDAECRMRDPGTLLIDSGCRIQDSRCRMQDAERNIQDSEFRTQDSVTEVHCVVKHHIPGKNWCFQLKNWCLYFKTASLMGCRP